MRDRYLIMAWRPAVAGLVALLIVVGSSWDYSFVPELLNLRSAMSKSITQLGPWPG